MTQIKIEVPANDHIALSAMADALQRIASERQHVDLTPEKLSDTQIDSVYVETPNVTDHDTLWKQMDKTFAEHNENTPAGVTQGEPCVQPVDVELARLDEDLEASIHHENTKHDEAFEEVLDSTLDADGIPHDKRIHSKGATRLADNTWRLRKRPADKTEEEWMAYIDSVKAELKAVQNIPTLDEQAVVDLTPPATLTDEQVREEIKEKLESGEVTVEAPLTPPVIDEPATQLEGVTPNGDVAIEPPVTTVGAPVAPVTPPTSLTPPIAEPSDQPSVTTFQELMLYMTSDAKKRGADNDMIKATLLEVDPALTAIPLIATRVDLIPKFVTALEAKLK